MKGKKQDEEEGWESVVLCRKRSTKLTQLADDIKSAILNVLISLLAER